MANIKKEHFQQQKILLHNFVDFRFIHLALREAPSAIVGVGCSFILKLEKIKRILFLFQFLPNNLVYRYHEQQLSYYDCL